MQLAADLNVIVQAKHILRAWHCCSQAFQNVVQLLAAAGGWTRHHDSSLVLRHLHTAMFGM